MLRCAQPEPVGWRGQVDDPSRLGRYPQRDWGAWCVTSASAWRCLSRVPAYRQHRRRGGEQFQCGLRTVAWRLGKAYQSAALPAGSASAIAVMGEQLVYVPGPRADARVLAMPGEPRCLIEWQAIPDLLQGRRARRAGRIKKRLLQKNIHGTKYGGTSMGSTERIRNVAKRVANGCVPVTRWSPSRRP